ncbi:MAG: dephospho-CoA kinase [Bacteroidales bacterium]
MRLGVTGGIGSGKTIVCRIFSILGVPVFSADDAAKEIMDNDESIKEKVNLAAGKNVYRNGILQRKELATIIFNNREILQKINSIVHPVLFEKFLEWEKMQHYPYVIMEAAILFESGADKLVDRILTVTAPESERVRRILERNNTEMDDVIARMKNQYDDNFRTARSHYVVDNSGEKLVMPEILRIHNELLSLSVKKIN